MTDFDRDKFANDFEEEHGWCPDAGYDIVKQWGNLTVGQATELNKKAKESCEVDG